ncbi:hypothetical protein [Streptomyces sp. NPDC006638]|uniref:hypothetical protein n=1 Tax=Streptomyces sp. NPDC006638 TaxID=3157183 RepID=UPI0033BBF8A5
MSTLPAPSEAHPTDVHIWDGLPAVLAWCGERRTTEEAVEQGKPAYDAVSCPGCLSEREQAQAIARDIGGGVDRMMMWDLD